MTKRERKIRVNYDLELKIKGVSERVCKKISKEMQKEIAPRVKEMIQDKHNVIIDGCDIEMVDFEFLDDYHTSTK